MALGVVGLVQTERFRVLKVTSIQNCQDSTSSSKESYNSFSGLYEVKAERCKSAMPEDVWKSIKEKEMIPSEVKNLCYYAQKDIKKNQKHQKYRNQIGRYICIGSIQDSLNFNLKFKEK